jgi:hypothetical protein
VFEDHNAAVTDTLMPNPDELLLMTNRGAISLWNLVRRECVRNARVPFSTWPCLNAFVRREIPCVGPKWV